MTISQDLKFGIAIPQVFPDGEIDPSLISGFVARAESLGYHSCWVQEEVARRVPVLDAVSLLCYAAAFTTRVRLGTSVLLTALRSPVFFAKSMASLDHLCRGRLTVGVGIGAFTGIYPAFGISPKTRVSRFEEGVSLIKRLWTEDTVTFAGRFWQLDGLSAGVKPLQAPHPPLWFGGRAEPALKRAARMGDGWMGAGASSTSAFKGDIKTIRRCLEEEGRDPATFPLSKRVYVAVDRDKKRAAERLRSWFGVRYGNADMAEEVSVYGSEEECVEGLAEVASQRIDLLMLNPVYDFDEQMERLAADVQPKL